MVISDPLGILVRACAGEQDAKAEAVDLVLRGVRAYLRSGGEIDLARCCGLPPPTARRKFARLRSHYWLCLAAQQIEAPTPWARSVALAHELQTFVSRVLPAWQHSAAPPPGASELRTALFNAVRADPGIKTSVRTVHRATAGVDKSAPPQSLFGEFEMKTIAQIERDAKIEWEFSPSLQAEFGNSLAAYQAYRRAEHTGRCRYENRPTSDKTPAGVGRDSLG